jgi:hypothetical protein
MPQLQMSPPWLAGITSDRDAEYIDAVQPGLVLRIRRGRMVWFVRYLFDGSARRYRIGEHPAVGLSAARKLASVVRGRVAAGDDPQAEKRAKREAVRRRRMGETVSGALASWLKDEKQGPIGRWKGGLEGGSARAALSHIRRLDRMLGKKLLSEVTPKEIERVVLACEAPATRNRALCAFRGFLTWAIRNGRRDHPRHPAHRGRCATQSDWRAAVDRGPCRPRPRPPQAPPDLHADVAAGRGTHALQKWGDEVERILADSQQHPEVEAPVDDHTQLA